MNKSILHKLTRSDGISRAMVVMLVLVGVMLIVVAIPVYQYNRSIAREIGCVQSLDTASRQMAVDLMMVNDEPTPEDIKALLTHAMVGWEDLCPAYGTVYIVKNPEGSELPYRLACGMHDPDLKERTRLNADHVLNQVITEVRTAWAKNIPMTENVVTSLNGGTVEVVLLDEPNDLRRGTGASVGHKGTEAYFTVNDRGTVSWFVYADENHAAVWRENDGWTGDSYTDN